MQKEDCFLLGKITKPHGLRGDVTVWLDVDIPEQYSSLKSILLDINGELLPYKLDKILIRGKKSIAKLDGISTIEQTEPIVGKDIYLPLEKLPKLKGNSFYFHEVLGYNLIDSSNNEIIGELKAVYESSGQDLFAVEKDEVEILIPIVDDFISEINHVEKSINLMLPDGLLDIYLNPKK